MYWAPARTGFSYLSPFMPDSGSEMLSISAFFSYGKWPIGRLPFIKMVWVISMLYMLNIKTLSSFLKFALSVKKTIFIFFFNLSFIGIIKCIHTCFSSSEHICVFALINLVLPYGIYPYESYLGGIAARTFVLIGASKVCFFRCVVSVSNW